MPLIRFLCSEESCNSSFVVFFKMAKDVSAFTECKVCGKKAKRTLSAPTSSSKIVIDNGQPRAVEVYSDIMDLAEDRIKPPNRGE